MIRMEDIISISISPAELAFCREQARAAEIGGRSAVRGSDRGAALAEDQIVGQIGTYAGHKLLFGDARLYRLSRYFANIYPTRGDGGSDVPGANVDFKASLRRAERPLLDYRLAVRPAERHAGMVYVLVLVERGYSCAHIIGWLAESALPAEPETSGMFAGAFIVQARALNAAMPLRWWNAAA